MHQDQLEQQLAAQLRMINPEAIGNDYHVAGMVERAEWNQGKQDPLSFERLESVLARFQRRVGSVRNHETNIEGIATAGSMTRIFRLPLRFQQFQLFLVPLAAIELWATQVRARRNNRFPVA